MRIAILGAGGVGRSLATGWTRAGHDVVFGSRAPTPEKAAEAGWPVLGLAESVAGADAIVLAVPFNAVGEVLAGCGDLTGRVLIDATNPLRMGAAGLELSIGHDTSAGEQVAALAPGAAVFKTLNQIGHEAMADNAGFPVRPVMFVAGDDNARKPVALQLVSDLGFEAVDAGGIAVSRLLEPLAMLWIHMALVQKTGRDRAFAYVRPG
jgi:predicted dinucleotide-binding enzyme